MRLNDGVCEGGGGGGGCEHTALTSLQNRLKAARQPSGRPRFWCGRSNLSGGINPPPLTLTRPQLSFPCRHRSTEAGSNSGPRLRVGSEMAPGADPGAISEPTRSRSGAGPEPARRSPGALRRGPATPSPGRGQARSRGPEAPPIYHRAAPRPARSATTGFSVVDIMPHQIMRVGLAFRSRPGLDCRLGSL